MSASRVLLIAAVLAAGCTREPAQPPPPTPEQLAAYRQQLFAELKPVKLTDCEFVRIGEATDGGYVMCRNLMARARSLYSYGINGNDNWGCSMSGMLKVPVHQYDCFNPKRPLCDLPDARITFHDECVGPERKTEDGRPFDTMASQFERNGDAGKTLIVKMDVEGSEWPSFLSAPDSVLNQIDQLSVEFHGVDRPEYTESIRKLKRIFHVVNVHYNNWVCDTSAAPFPSTAFEVLFVNRNIATVDPAGVPPIPNPLDFRNNFPEPDCQLPPEAYGYPPQTPAQPKSR